ncbi:hypothetical protein [Ornithinibacillus halophilus]|uniref:Uncharacterized protein n=1 Tax=Ornithinibacillus halophilus TaxID=930117 RepID=A0A1M5IS08_9BACI|nr:hypothetical protein [Ornithinibacillus halophilus]SHG30533.1 hypothetical protein SAMN05216225_102539 [Ornithinibacillus halophilus]
MSDNKRIIKVKDLVIEAENVIIEPKRRPMRDPFFGGFDDRRRVDDIGMESSSSSSSRSGELLGDDDRKDDDRRPFWI